MDVYDFGGPEGLISAAASGKKLLDFGTEQQAEIMQQSFYEWKRTECVQKAKERGYDPFKSCQIPEPYYGFVLQLLDGWDEEAYKKGEAGW